MNLASFCSTGIRKPGVWALQLALAVAANAAAGSGLAASLQVTDDAGRSVVLAQPARRVISLAPHATELLFDVGAGNALVAVSDYSDYPPPARLLPRIGGVQGIDLERVLKLKPDLVVAWTSGNSTREVEAIEKAGIAVFRSDPHRVDAVAENLEKLGFLVGHEKDGEDLAKRYREEVAALSARYSELAPVTVFYQVWNKPLMTVGGAHLISQVIRLCGGRNIFDSLEALAPTVDPEAVIARDPRMIAVASDLGRGREELAQWRRWPKLAAVRENNLVVLDPAFITRATPRLVIGATQLCQAIDAARNESR